MAKVLKQKDIAAATVLLSKIADATKSEQGFMYVKADGSVPEHLVERGLIVFNPQMTNEHGETAVKATDAGLAMAGGAVAVTQNADGEVTTEAVAPVGNVSSKPVYSTMFANVPKPAHSSNRAGRGETYPWSELAEQPVGVSFFVAATETMPNPAKSIASAVTGANKRYEGKARFSVIAVADGGPWGFAGVNGAAVYREELKATAPAAE